MTERQAARIFEIEYNAACVEGASNRDREKHKELIRRSTAVRKLAAVCHDRHMIAKVSGTPVAIVKRWLGDKRGTWPNENQVGCA